MRINKFGDPVYSRHVYFSRELILEIKEYCDLKKISYSDFAKEAAEGLLKRSKKRRKNDTPKEL